MHSKGSPALDVATDSQRGRSLMKDSMTAVIDANSRTECRIFQGASGDSLNMSVKTLDAY